MGSNRLKTAQIAVVGVIALATLALIMFIFNQQAERRAEAGQARLAYAAEIDRRDAEVIAQREVEVDKARRLTADNAETARATVQADDDLTVAVFGDSTGNELGEWVSRWAEDLAIEGATVELRQWDGQDHTWKNESAIFGSGDRAVTIWNGSYSGGTPFYPAEHQDIFPDDADLVITSYGHNGSVAQNQEGLRDLLDDAATRWGADIPTTVIVQNPAAGESESQSAANHDAVREVAADRNLPLIDVQRAFMEAGDLSSLLTDDVHPNPDGSALWAETVAAFFNE